MKVTNIRRKLIATLAAGGLLSPAAAYAANLDTNLVVNGGFENIDFGTLSTDYSGPLILDWANMGFAYSHDGTAGVPDYANPEPLENPFPGDPDTPLVNGGSWYFGPALYTGATIVRHDSPATAITQTINVSSGATATAIAAGTARFNLSAYFSTYFEQTDRGVVQVDFLGAALTNLGTRTIGPSDDRAFLTTWTPFANNGLIPVGTQSVLVSAFSIAEAGSPSGYMDNVNFTVTNGAVIEPALELIVNRDTDNISITNQTGGSVTFSSYSITSGIGALAPPPPGTGATLANGGPAINLGNIWLSTPVEDLTFSYISSGIELPGMVTYIGNGGNTFEPGDLNTDGAINAADWMQFRANQHANLSMDTLAAAYRRGDLDAELDNDFDDFQQFKILYDEANGVGAFVAMVESVPEPASLTLASLAGVFALGAARRFR